jgi:MFS family permease
MSDEQAVENQITPRILFQQANFRNLWFGQVVSAFGDNVTNLTLLILVNALTGSTAALATMTILLAIPQVTIGLVAGVFVDRVDRKRIMLAADLVRGLLVLGFIAVGSAERLWLLYLLGFLQACAGAFFNPARSALMPSLVPPEGLLAANSAMQTGSLVAQVLGAGAAGLLVGLFHAYWPAFVIDALTFFFSLLMILLVRVAASQAQNNRPVSARAIFHELGEGLGLLLRTRVLAGVLVVTAVMMLGLGTVNVLFVPLLANELYCG